MLILTRKLNQKIIIADGEIEVTVLDVKGNQVRIGVQAPKFIQVHRQEVFEKIQQEKKELNQKN